jgi:ABC-type microcin C transport system permease subunit YejB
MEAEKQRALQELEEQMRLELQDLTEKHKQAISEIKKKQWVCISLGLYSDKNVILLRLCEYEFFVVFKI